jgi:hypothetical protein
MLLVLVLGCAAPHHGAPAADPPSITPPPDDLHAGCPLGIPDTRVQISDTKEGVALTFTTCNRIDELRYRIRDAAAMHGPRAHLGLAHDGRHDLGQGHGLRLWSMPVGHASVQDVDLSARLSLDANSPLQVDELRSRLRDRIGEIRLARACE